MTETTTTETPAPDALAAALANAPFVRLVATDDGDALAATGLLARALRERAIPFQARVSADPIPDTSGEDLGVIVGTAMSEGGYALPGGAQPASVTAAAVARALGAEPDPVITLAGVVAAGSIPGADGSDVALATAEKRSLVTRRPGVAIPTADLSTGLAASTLCRAPWSGDLEATQATLADLDLPAALDADAHRRLASLVAIDVAAAPEASTHATTAVESALRPYAITDEAPSTTVGGLAGTIGGLGDVLDVLAREAPGTGIALLLAEEAAEATWEAAIDVWRTHGTAAHRALDTATIGRYDGCVIARVEASPAVLPTVARLVLAFRSPEPVAIAVDESRGRVAVAAAEPLHAGNACRTVAAEVDATGWGTSTRGGLELDGEATEHTAAEALAALREAL